MKFIIFLGGMIIFVSNLYAYNDKEIDKMKKNLEQKGIKVKIWADRKDETYFLLKRLNSLKNSDLDKLSKHKLSIIPFKDSQKGYFYRSKSSNLYMQKDFDLKDVFIVLSSNVGKNKIFQPSDKKIKTIKNHFNNSHKSLTYFQKEEERKQVNENYDHLIKVFTFRRVENEEKLFNILTHISKDESPLLYKVSRIIPVIDYTIRKEGSVLYIYTGSLRQTIVSELSKINF